MCNGGYKNLFDVINCVFMALLLFSSRKQFFIICSEAFLIFFLSFSCTMSLLETKLW